MVEPSSPLRERREAQRARLRRRRQFGAAAALLLIAAAVIAVAVAGAHGGGSGHHRLARRPAPASSTRAGARSVAAGSTSGSGAAGGAGAADAAGIARIQQLAQLGLPVYCAGPRGNEVAFTFDDGPGPYTHLALRKLGQAGERATFFVVGRSMNNFPGWVQREVSLAAIGDHTMTHPFLPELSASEIEYQLGNTKQMIEQATGQPVYLFRPPYGSHTPTVDATAKRLGLLEILWSVDSADSLGANWAGIIHNVEAGLHPGAIILMHENRGQTIRALTTLLPELHRRHLRSVSLPELFASDPPSVAQLREGGRGCASSASLSSGS